jgi:hypothetical protein
MLMLWAYWCGTDESLWAWVQAAALVETWPGEAAARIAAQYSLSTWLANDLIEQVGTH